MANQLVAMDRPDLIRMLRRLECGFRLDFTDEFLNGVSVERLRHIVLAACLHAQNPTGPSAAT